MSTTLLFLCLKIFFTRILDVSLGTFRTMLVVKDKRALAVLIGFMEVLIWFLVVKDALNSGYDSIWIAISYAGGFAAGTYTGMFISDKYISSILTLQVITTMHKSLVQKIRNEGFAVTETKVYGIDGKTNKHMLLITIKNKDYYKINKIIKEIDKDAFLVISENKYARNGYFINQIKK